MDTAVLDALRSLPLPALVLAGGWLLDSLSLLPLS